jgi:hypothetical protein
MLPKYGINERASLSKASFGQPIVRCKIIDGNLTFTDTYRVPLIIDDKYVALLTVEKRNDNTYDVVSFGGNILAEQLYESRKNKSILGILRVYELKKDFFYIQSDDTNCFIEVQDASNYCTLEDLLNLIDSEL